MPGFNAPPPGGITEAEAKSLIATALADFVYLPPDEVEQDLSIIAARAGIGAQTMRNAQDIGLLKTALFCK